MSTMSTIGDVRASHAFRDPDAPAIIYSGIDTLSFGALERHIQRIGAQLMSALRPDVRFHGGANAVQGVGLVFWWLALILSVLFTGRATWTAWFMPRPDLAQGIAIALLPRALEQSAGVRFSS